MKKKLAFSLAILAAASFSASAGVLFSEDWSAYASGSIDSTGLVTEDAPLDPTRWRVDNGCFGSGIYVDCYGDFKFNTDGAGSMYMSGYNGDVGYWAGFSIVSVPTFSVPEGKVLVFETTRIHHGQSGSSSDRATRTGLWLIAPDKSKWLLFADDFGECSWSFNPYSGLASDYPVNAPSNVGYDINTFNTLFANVLHEEVNIRVAVDGKTASFWMKDPNAENPVWVLGRTQPLNFSENIAVGLGVYARTPSNSTMMDSDFVDAQFGGVTVSEMDYVQFAKTSMTIAGGDESEVTLTISPSATPTTVTVYSSDASILIPEGQTSGSATVSFAAGETEKVVKVKSLTPGKVTLSVNAGENILANNSVAITCSETVGVKLFDDFDGDTIDSDLWDISTKGYEYRSYPDADVKYEFFGVGGGQFKTTTMESIVNYWGGRSVVSKNTFVGSKSTSLKISSRVAYMEWTGGTSAQAMISMHNADSSKFFALRYNRGEGGWQYNTAIGASGTKPGEWANFNDGLGHDMEILYDGEKVTPYVDGIPCASVAWVCNDPMYVEAGFHVHSGGSIGSGAFDWIKIENIQANPPTGTVTPSTVRAYEGFNNVLAVTIPEEATLSDDLTVEITSENTGIATPEISTLTFKKGGDLTQYVNVICKETGLTRMNISVLEGVDWLKFPVVTVDSKAGLGIVFSDNFPGASIDTGKWQAKTLTQTTAKTRDLLWWVESGELLGTFANGSTDGQQHVFESQLIKSRFFATPDDPVIIEYMAGPLGGRGNTFSAQGMVVNPDTLAGVGFGYTLGDVIGWNRYPSFASASADNRPSAFRQDRFMDNASNHKVRLVYDGSVVRCYVDDVEGGTIDFVSDCITFGLGGAVSIPNNYTEFAFSDVKVYGSNMIKIGNTDVLIPESESTATFPIYYTAPIAEQGTSLTLTMDNPAVAEFDTGATKTIKLNPAASEVVVTVKRKGAGVTSLSVVNDGGYEQNAEMVYVTVVAPSDLLFEDNFTTPEISTIDWVRDNTPFEPTYASAKADVEVYSGGGVDMSVMVTEQYWPGCSYYLTKSYSASKLNPVSFEIDRTYFGCDGATGARSAFWAKSANGTPWIMFSESSDSDGYVGWGYNDNVNKATGQAIRIPAFAQFEDKGMHTIRMTANGETLTIAIDGVVGFECPFAVSEGIRFGFGCFARANGDICTSGFANAKVYGSENPGPNPPMITNDPVSTSANVGSAATFVVGATGTDLTYAWYKDGIPLEYISSPTLVIPGANTDDEGVYTVRVSNESGSIVSNPALLTVAETAATEFVGTVVGLEAGGISGDFAFDPTTGEYAVYGCGSDIWGSEDHFYFLYQPAPEGDFSITARMTSYLNPANAYGRAGLMIREGAANGGFAADSRYAVSQVYRQSEPGNANYRSQYRTAIGESVNTAPNSNIATPWPNWQRLTREGTSIAFAVSEDGVNWTTWSAIDTANWEGGALGSELPLYVGLWNTTHDLTAEGVAVFDNVVVGSAAPIPPSISVQPVGALLTGGESYTMTVEAGPANVSYQWNLNGNAIPGATASSYTIASASKASEGAYTVLVSNRDGKVMSDAAMVTVLNGLLFSDDFSAPALDPESWVNYATPFEYAANPNGRGESTITTGEGLTIDFTLTDNYWGGDAYYVTGEYSVANGPVIFEVNRKAFAFDDSATGARCSFIVSSKLPLNDSAAKWINFSDSRDDVGYIGWGYNDSLTKPAGQAVLMNALNAIPGMMDKGNHTVRIVVNGQTADFYVDGILGASVPFAVQEGIRFGVGAYTRMAPDHMTVTFGSANVWANTDEPQPEVPMLGWEVVDGNLVLTWSASSKLESADSADATAWVEVQGGEIESGRMKLVVPIDSTLGSIYFRAVAK